MSNAFLIKFNDIRYEERGGHWYATAENGNVCELEIFPAAFFPLLEVSIATLTATHPAAERFPFGVLLKRAASSESSYWQERALERIEEMNLLHECAEAVRRLAVSGLNQKIRHKATYLLKRVSS